jgi:D-alanyl-D-alanine carboxypeptidase/D-alanyl-D-alanine-endopeptidase (penicillin-binding protein 4)
VKRAFVVLMGTALLASAANAAHAATRGRHRSRPVNLVWHVETLAGETVESRLGDEPINPASVVKIATSLWALDRLGPDFHYETRFFARGRVDQDHHALLGDLVVLGSGDPDFHAENAFLVAQALNRLGVERVTGSLIVNKRFWIGWENGSEGRIPDPTRRAVLMATRLRQALDPRRWNGLTRGTWREFAARRGLDARRPPRVVISGGVGTDGDASEGEMLVVHRSQPLVEILRRFNCYSNNDIERVAAGIGTPDQLADMVAQRCGVPRDEVELETASGLGTNRLTPRIIVRLLREFRATCERLKVPLQSVLPVAGCDPGTVSRFFPLLASDPNTTSVLGKTGTLTNTDGGVAVLAGFARTSHGDYVFCVAVPRAGGRLKGARRAEEKWVVDFLDQNGGGQPHPCAPPLPGPDAGANIILLGDRVLPPQGAASTSPVAASH